MITIEVVKDYKDGHLVTERKFFESKKDMYKYILFDFLEKYLELAREDLDSDTFTGLCLNICGFIAEYFT